MKKAITKIIALICVLTFVCLAGCSPIDRSEEVESSEPTKESNYENVKIPEISSDDTVMPTYIDISLYNAQNFAEIYLGTKFNPEVTYCGKEITLPCSYKNMADNGYTLVSTDEYAENSMVLAGKTQKVYFQNEDGNQIVAVFKNSSNSSVELRKCKIVKMIISENNLYKENSVFGDFYVNGITNHSAITDIVEYLGAPSHFYAVDETHYYLDYYISGKDLRPAIRVYIDSREDIVNSIEFAKY